MLARETGGVDWYFNGLLENMTTAFTHDLLRKRISRRGVLTAAAAAAGTGALGLSPLAHAQRAGAG
ncbi:MAG: twin-arginine translocation signal domain-containing protein, partial [Rubrivivax sp.]